MIGSILPVVRFGKSCTLQGDLPNGSLHGVCTIFQLLLLSEFGFLSHSPLLNRGARTYSQQADKIEMEPRLDEPLLINKGLLHFSFGGSQWQVHKPLPVRPRKPL